MSGADALTGGDAREPTPLDGHRRAHDFEARQQDDAVETRPIVTTAIAGIVVGAVAVAVAAGVLLAETGAVRTHDAPLHISQRDAPRAISDIEQTPILDTKAGIDLKERQERALDRWGWVDRDAGIAEIPIEQAIDVVVSRSAP